MCSPKHLRTSFLAAKVLAFESGGTYTESAEALGEETWARIIGAGSSWHIRHVNLGWALLL